MDMRKEIKLSDLFKRKPKEEQVVEADPVVTEAPEKKPSRFSLTRGKSEDGAPKAEKAPKAPKEPRRKKSAKGAGPALPAVPLMRAFNLMPTDTSAGADGMRANPVRLALAVAALVVFALLTSIFLIANASVADKQQELNDLKGQLAALDVPAEAPAPQGADPALIAERDARTAALSSALGGRIAWDRVLRDLSLVLPDDVWLTTMISTGGVLPATEDGAPSVEQVEASQSVIELNGFSRTPESVAQLLSRVQVLPEVESAALVTATTTTLSEQELVQFTISVTLKPPGATS
jgi:Tfp pilus assembly protein PilN